MNNLNKDSQAKTIYQQVYFSVLTGLCATDIAYDPLKLARLCEEIAKKEFIHLMMLLEDF